MAKLISKSFASTRSISTSTHLSQRLNQTENEIVNMFRLPNASDQTHSFPMSRNMPRKDPSVRTLDDRFTKILKIFKWGPDAEKALEVLKLRVDHRLVLAVLKIDVEAVVKVKFFKWAGKRRNFQHNSTTYMALIRCLDEAGMVGEMWKTIQEMVRSVRVIDPAELSEIMRILGRAKMVNKAVSVFYQIKGHKCMPTAHSYNSMILMLMQEGHHEKVHELYNEMCNESNCSPDTVTYSALISAFGKLGRDDSAIRLFDEMKDNGLHPTAKIYTTLLAIFFKLGKVEKALSLVQEMKENGCPPTVYTYTELIKGLGKAGRVEDAYATYKNLLKEGCKPDVVLMNNLINILGKEGRIETAIKLFDELDILRCTPNVVTYNMIIKALFDSKAPAVVAASWFEKMKVNGVIPSSFTYSIMIDGFCKTNRVEKALLLLEEMDEKGFPPCPAAYCSLINSLGKAKRYEAANELFQELKENCGRASARVYAVMIKHFGKCGRLDEALDLFHEMKKLGCNPDIYTYNALMSGMVRAGMIDEALTLLKTMGERGCVADINSQNIILNGLARAGGPTRALEMFSKMKHSKIQPDAVSYNTILGCLSRAGLLEEAAKLMKEMTSKGFQYDLITYSSILEAVGKVDEVHTTSLRGSGIAPENRVSSRMNFFKEHSFGNEHVDPIEVDSILVSENVSPKHANIKDVVPRRKSSTRKRSSPYLESVEGEGTSLDLQRFNDGAIGVSQVSEDSERSFAIDDDAIDMQLGRRISSRRNFFQNLNNEETSSAVSKAFQNEDGDKLEQLDGGMNNFGRNTNQSMFKT